MIQGVNEHVRYDAWAGAPEQRGEAAAGGSSRVLLTEPQPETGKTKEGLSEEERNQRFTQLKKLMQEHEIEISYNEEVDRYAITVMNAETKEVIREIPGEKMLQMFERMLEMEGLLVDEKR